MEDVYRFTRSPAWEELEPEKGQSTAGIHAHVVGAVGGSGAVDESSDSEGEQEGPQKLIRKVSTSGQLRSKTSVKEGLLLKQTSSFQRWKKRYFKLRGRTLYYAKDAKSLIFDEVDLSDASVAESSTKNVNNSFTVDEREGYPKHPVTLNFSIYPAVCNRRDQRRPPHHADIE
uniref:PH domain-containing protein n=1 Tax=Oncorhynchus tshawytscha TaxID=74940 RepID=A0A8C8H8H3_ONCTS